jgi:hypothetical protein
MPIVNLPDSIPSNCRETIVLNGNECRGAPRTIVPASSSSTPLAIRMDSPRN